MKGRIDLRYTAEETSRIKSRLAVPEGANFSLDYKDAVAEAVLEVIKQNSLTLRSEVEKHLYSKGYAPKKDAYQKALDTNCKELYAMVFSNGPAPVDVIKEE